MFDVIVIGGGITGAGVLRDAAMRGWKALLVEKGRPGHATTLSSTHLIHGGLRYLLYDRLTTHASCWDAGHIVRIAKPLLNRLPILWPVYHGHQHGMETVETLLEGYDQFQRMKYGRAHLRLTAEEARNLIPGLKADGLKGAVMFDEWWVDPVALVEANLASARRAGAEVRGGEAVESLLRDGDKVAGVRLRKADGSTEDISAKTVVNAGGPWVDKIAALGGQRVPLRLRQGSHLVYKKAPAAVAGGVGLLVEAIDRGRYVFVIPGGDGGALVGPTDVGTSAEADHLKTSDEEIAYLLASVHRYLPEFPARYDGLAVGARPILGQAGAEKLLSREFEVFNHAAGGAPGFYTVAGGKMSDFRLMGEAAGRMLAPALGGPLESRTHLETLEGKPVGPIPQYRQPAPWLKRFLRSHPRLREAHAWAYLAAGFGRHLLRRRPTGKPVTPQLVSTYYEVGP